MPVALTLCIVPADRVLLGFNACSLPKAHVIPPGLVRPVAAYDGSPPLTSQTQLACIDHIHAVGLRGALDWQSGGESSTALLSIFSGADVGTAWGTLLHEIAVSATDRSVQSTQAGDRLRLDLNRSSCFATPVPEEAASGPVLCFQIADFTTYGGHVRYVNRGCGVLNRAVGAHSIALNDGARLTMHVIFKSQSGGPLDVQIVLAMTVPFCLVIVCAIAVLIRRYRRARSGHCSLRTAMLACCAKVIGALGFSALEAELLRSATSRHTLLARHEPRLRPTRRKARPSVTSDTADEDPTASEVDTVDTMSHGLREQEAALKRAMALIEGTETAVPTTELQMGETRAPRKLSPTKPSTSAVPYQDEQVAPAMPESKLLADIVSILSQSDVLSTPPQLEDGDSLSEAGGLSADLATVGALPKELLTGDASAGVYACNEGASDVSYASILRRGSDGTEDDGLLEQGSSHTLRQSSRQLQRTTATLD